MKFSSADPNIATTKGGYVFLESELYSSLIHNLVWMYKALEDVLAYTSSPKYERTVCVMSSVMTPFNTFFIFNNNYKTLKLIDV